MAKKSAKRVEKAGLSGGLLRTALPEQPGLMLCKLLAEPFDDPAWVFEPKLDGLRVLCRFDGKTLTMASRNDKEQKFLFPDVAEPLRRALSKPAVLDGEVVCLDENGQSSFRAIQQRFHLSSEAEVAKRSREHPAYLYLFDVLHFDGRDVTALPLVERKKVLKRAVKWSKQIRFTPGTVGDGTKLLKSICATHGEGIVGKRLESRYADSRSGDWVKIKCENRQEFVIGGYTDPQNTRIGLGALLVGYFDGDELVYAGKVGTGFTDQLLRELKKDLAALALDTSPFVRGGAPHGRGVHWVKPTLIGEIAFSEWTQNGSLRHPRFEGLRMDKKASSVSREKPVATTPASRRGGGASRPAKNSTLRVDATQASPLQKKKVGASGNDAKGVAFTHLDRVVFPESGLTKGDVLEFYSKVGDKLLPHLRDRPVTIERYPDGVGEKKPHFWQKNSPEYYPKWIELAKVKDVGGKPVNYAIVNDLRTLLYLANQNALTFHISFSRVSDLAQPDFVLFDIDPHQSTFANAVTVAKKVHELLDEEGVENFVKTTGKSGLHVETPWEKKRGGYDAVREWAFSIAQRVAAALPKIATTERMIAKRGNRVYVDVMQNAEGKHAVPPYVIRATANGSVAMPLSWSELNGRLTPGKFDLKSAMKRIVGMKTDPLAGLLKNK